jgi:hypothetical protein
MKNGMTRSVSHDPFSFSLHFQKKTIIKKNKEIKNENLKKLNKLLKAAFFEIYAYFHENLKMFFKSTILYKSTILWCEQRK